MTAHFARAGLDENGLYQAPIDRARRGHSDEVWLRAREAYEGGLSVQVAREWAGVSRSALFERARREGWRRPAPRGWVSDEEMREAAARPPLKAEEAAEEAWEQASLALRLGRLAETAAWTRLHRQFRQMVREDEAREAKRHDPVRRDYEAFVRAIQAEAGLELAHNDITAAAQTGEADEADLARANDYAELQTRLHAKTGAFVDACDRTHGRRAGATPHASASPTPSPARGEGSREPETPPHAAPWGTGARPGVTQF